MWSIVCFVVGRRARGRGVAAALLDAAIDYARDHGATTLEAYPVEVPAGRRIPSANVYHGTLSMFERAGFRGRGAAPGQRRQPGPTDRPARTVMPSRDPAYVICPGLTPVPREA